jgi:hypothetical protein
VNCWWTAANWTSSKPAALKQFIQDIGGLENALAAVAMLGELEEAA